jgi:O-antigen ligase
MIFRKIVLALLCGVVLFMPWEELVDLGGNMTISRGVGYGALGMGLLAVVTSMRLRPLPLPLVLLGLYAAWTALSSVWSLIPEDSLFYSRTNLMLFGFTWMVWEFAPDMRQQRAILITYVIGSTGPLLNQMFAFRSTDAADLQRVGAFLVNENTLAVNVIVSIAIVFYFSTILPGWLRSFRPLFWGYMIVAAFASLLTASRGGVVCLAAVIATILVTSGRVSWKTTVLFLLLAGPAAYVLPKMLPEQVMSRLGEGTEAHSYQIRLDLWSAGLSALPEAPMQGFGFTMFRHVSASHGGPDLVAHNTWVSLLVEGGLVGFSLFIGALVTACWGIRGLPRKEQMLCLTMLPAYLPMTLSGSLEFNKVFWLLIGLTVCITRGVTKPRQLPAASSVGPFGRRVPGT